MLVDQFRKILADRALVPTPDDCEIVLEEEQADMKLTINRLPTDDLVVIGLNKLQPYSGLKNGDWKKKCDFMLLGHVDGQYVAILIEMKRTFHDTDKYKRNHGDGAVTPVFASSRLFVLHLQG